MTAAAAPPAGWSIAQKRRIDELLLEAAGLDGPEREPILEGDTYGDPAVIAEVRRRLAAADALDDDYLAAPTGLLDLLGGFAAAPSAAGDAEEGEELPPASRYTLLRLLGEGGMAEVHEAIDHQLERRVALKLLRPHSPAFGARLIAEARAQARVQHDHVLEVYETGILDGRPFIAMRLVAGETLGEIAEALPLEQRVRLLAQAAEGLHAAHRCGLLHLDVKPSNILVGHSPEGEPRAWVGDFGIAVADGQAGGQEDLVGTPQFIAPERLQEGRVVDRRADVFSLGVTLYRVLGGGFPFPGRTPLTILQKVRAGEPLPLAEQAPFLPPDLRAIVEKCLADDPDRRYPSARAVAEDLRRFLEGDVVEAHTAGLAYRLTRFAQRHRILLAIAGSLGLLLVLALLAAAGLGYQALRNHRGLQQRQAQAEALVSFMLGDLRDRLDPLGRLDLLAEVGNRAMAYFAAVPAGELSAEELSRRAEALNQIGDVRIRQGELAAAAAAFEESLALARRLAEQEPASLERRFGLGQSCFWVGYAHWEAGNLEPAQRHLEAYLAISRELVERQPDNAAYRLELSNAQSNMGSLLQERGQLAAALASFEEAYATLRPRPLAEEPADPGRLSELAAARNSLAVVLRLLGRFDEARLHSQAELALRRRRAALDAADWPAQDELATALHYQAILDLAQQRYAEAAPDLQEALALFDALMAHDPENGAWRYKRLWVLLRQATLDDAEGRLGPSRRRMEDALEEARRLAARDPSQLDWARTVAIAQLYLGRSLVGGGFLAPRRQESRVPPAAVRQAGEALAALESFAAAHPDDRQGQWWLAEARLLRAELAAGAGQQLLARELRQAAAAALAPLAEGSQDYRILDPWRRCLEALGRHGEAAEVRRRLEALGFRPAGAAAAR